MTTCEPCADLINRWIDAFQDHGPINGWRQYTATPETRARRSAEVFTMRVNDRAALIRWQIAHIRATCNHQSEPEVAA